MIAPLETIKNKIERKSSIMSRFDTYFLMKEADVIEYVKAKYPDFFAPEAVLTVKEIGDGNLYTYPVSRVYSISVNVGF